MIFLPSLPLLSSEPANNSTDTHTTNSNSNNNNIHISIGKPSIQGILPHFEKSIALLSPSSSTSSSSSTTTTTKVYVFPAIEQLEDLDNYSHSCCEDESEFEDSELEGEGGGQPLYKTGSGALSGSRRMEIFTGESSEEEYEEIIGEEPSKTTSSTTATTSHSRNSSKSRDIDIELTKSGTAIHHTKEATLHWLEINPGNG